MKRFLAAGLLALGLAAPVHAADIYNMADSWTDGSTYTAIKMNVTDTSSNAASLLMDLQVGGTSKFRVSKAGVVAGVAIDSASPTYANTTSSANGLGFYGSGTRIALIADGVENVLIGNSAVVLSNSRRLEFDSAATGTGDVSLSRDAAGVLAQRNGTNAQEFRIYDTYTDASNYSRGYFGFITDAGIFAIGTQAAGTGTVRDIEILAGTGKKLYLGGGAASSWNITSTGHFLAQTDNTYDIGADGATRPRNVYIAGTIAIGSSANITSSVTVGAGAQYVWNGRSTLTSPSNGIVTVANNSDNDFGRLQFGGTTSSFPALKRSTTSLEVKLADDSAYAPFRASRFANGNKEAITVDGATTFAVTSGYITLACTGAETINTITGGLSGQELIIENTDTECTIADDDDATAADAIDLTGTATTDVGAVAKVVKLLYNGANWMQVGESDN
jgi:hypothetical protein